MKYLSIDIEATGLMPEDLIIEFAAVPFCSKESKIEDKLTFHHYIKCPSFEELRPNLNPWVIDHNKKLIEKSHAEGITLESFREGLAAYLTSEKIINYFGKNNQITLFGKSLSAIDLPFLSRDLGHEFMRNHFQHRQLDLTSVAYQLIDMNYIPEECSSGTGLMKFLKMGDVCHTALEDALNTAKMYLKILELFKRQ